MRGIFPATVVRKDAITADAKPNRRLEIASTVSDGVFVAVSGSPDSEALVRAGKQLADVLGVAWQAVHVETPASNRESPDFVRAADALSLAAGLGATVAMIPAGTVVDGITAHLQTSPAGHLVLGSSRPRGRGLFRRASLLDLLSQRGEGRVLHVHGSQRVRGQQEESARIAPSLPVSAISYLYAFGAVAATSLAAEVLQVFLGTRSLDLLFLFPVIAVAARLGLRPALLAVALSVVSYNYFLLTPSFSFNPTAPQNLVMTAVLIAVATYTGVVTTRMRGRLLLSDRSARENASVAALAQKLTRDAVWEDTAQTVCEHVQALFDVQTALFREVGGSLAVAGAIPADPRLNPLDQTALDLAWQDGNESGAGTTSVSAADWQFQPLKTSLGVLAVLGLAREDGRNPVRADQRTLLLTVVAQAALAHERLRLEDLMRAEARHGSSEP